MSYYTNYKLELYQPIDHLTVDSDIISKLRNFSSDADYALDEYGSTSEPCSWYDHTKDLKRFSKKYPDVLFKLNGEGEESTDMWIKYFKNGKMQHCPAQITFDKFDENKLK